MTVYTIQASFSRGEISPKLHGRVDIDHYRLSLAEARNWVVLRQGGLRRRTGTVYVGEVKDSTDEGVRLIPFAFSTSQAYAIEMGDAYCRFFALDGQVYSGGSPYEIVSPYAIGDVSGIHYSQSADVLYMAHGSYAPRELIRSGETSWSFASFQSEDGPFLDVNTTGTTMTPGSIGGVHPIMTSASTPSGTVSTSFGVGAGTMYKVFNGNAADGVIDSASVTGTIQYTPATSKVADGYWIQAHSVGEEANYCPSAWTFEGFNGSSWIVLDSRSGENGFAASERRYYEFTNETAYSAYRLNITSSGSATARMAIANFMIHERAENQTAFGLTASSTAGINNGAGFSASDVGRSLKLLGSDGLWRWAEIVGVGSATFVTIRLYGHALPSRNGITSWRLGSWSTGTGYPQCVGSFQNRLAWGGTETEPRTIWLSKSAEYEDYGFSQPVEASDGITLTMTGARVNAIQFIEESASLLVGTSGSLRSVGPATASEAFSATNAEQRQQTTTGAAHIQPISIGYSTLFVNYYRNRIHESGYSYDVDGYRSPELSILSDHLFADGIKEMAFQAVPDNIIWVVRESGKMATVTFEKSQEIVGLTPCEIAGTNAAVESVCSIPVESGDRTWLIVKRTINGQTKRYVEYIADPYENSGIEDAVYFDSSVRVYNATAFSTVTGAGHLEGETVGVLADGVDIGDATVSGGSFTLPGGVTANTVVYGLRFQSYGKTLRLSQAGNRDGTALGRLKNVMSVAFDVYETGYLKVGGISKQYPLLRAEVAETPGTPITPFTGMVTDGATDSWRDDGVIVFHTDKGYPATVRAASIGIEGEP